MDLFSKSGVKNLLKKYQIRPSKRLGQNFLIDKGAIRKIIAAADLQPDDVVLEIGPGIGNLTQELAKRAKKVIAVEKDQKMVKILQRLLECWNVKNVMLIQEDILKLNSKPYTLKLYKVVGNLPFYLTAPVIRKFLETVEVKPQQMIFVVQKEVAQRICAKPPDMNLLAVSVQFYAEPKIISYISRKSFWPSPKVDSAIIKIIPKKLSTKPGNVDLFFKIVRAGFSHPRKQLINNLSTGLNTERQIIQKWLLKNNIQPSQRGETLSIQDWIELTKTFIMK